MRTEYNQIFDKNGRFLLGSISLKSYLLTILESQSIIEPIERKRILAGEIEEDQVQRLVDILKEKDDSVFSKFCAALREDEQAFIAERLEREEQDMYSKWFKKLLRKRCDFVEKLDPNIMFLDKLFSLGVLTLYAKEHILSKPTKYKKVEAILDYMEKRPGKQLVDFRTALVFNDQSHILDLFDD